jgi:hypothetical protein
VLIIETLPFTEIFHLAISTFSVRNDTFGVAEVFEFLPLTFFVQQEGFYVLAGKARSSETRLPQLVSLDVVIHPLKAFKALEELIGLIGVVQMGEILPFYMKALHGALEPRSRVTTKDNPQCSQTRDPGGRSRGFRLGYG